MKKLVYVLSSLIASVAVSSPQVTPRQMTNFVEKATANCYTQAVDAAKAYTDTSVTTGVESAKGYADTKSAEALSSAKTYANTKKEEAVSSAVEYASSAASTAVATAKSYTDTEVADLKEYVDSLVTTNGATTAEDIAKLITPDDELHIDTNGVAYINVLESIDGKLRNQRYDFQITNEVDSATELGAKVMSTTDVDLPTGTLFAKTGDFYVSNVSRTDYPSPKFRIDAFNHTNANVRYTKYIVSGCATNTVAGIRYIVTYSGWSAYSDINVTQTFYSTNLTSGATSTTTRDFEVVGFKIFHDKWQEITGKTTYDATSDNWCGLSNQGDVRFRAILRQIIPDGQAFAPVRKFRLADLFFPSAYAASQDYESIVGLGTPEYIGPYVSVWEYANNGETPETHKASPSGTVPEQKAYDDITYWTTPALNGSIAVSYRNSKGDLITTEVKIKKVVKYWEFYLAAGLPWPPRPYPAITFKEKNKDCYKGHIYGANCICTVCGHSRSHEFDEVQATDEQCAKCKNKYTNWTTDEDGIKVPDGKLDQQCNHKCEYRELKYHAGWHHVQFTPDNDQKACCCQCGTFNLNPPLDHLLPQESTVTTWTDSGDGRRHYGTVNCQRGNCNHEAKYYQNHFIDSEEITDWLYDGPNGHKGQGTCNANGCTYQGYVTQAHDFPDEGEGPELCWCDTCDHYCHKFGDAEGCGRYPTEITHCKVCGIPSSYAWGQEQQWWSLSDHGKIPVGEETTLHDFEPPWVHYKDYNVHNCGCGRYTEKHIFVNGKCKCGFEEKKKGGHSCPLGHLAGHDDGDHEEDRSGHGLGTQCPDGKCRTSIHTLFPRFDASMPATGGINSWSGRDDKGIAQNLQSDLLGGNGGQVVARIDTWLGLFHARSVGCSGTFYLWLNGSWKTVGYDPFTGVTYTNMVYEYKLERHGSIMKDEDGVKYIQW